MRISNKKTYRVTAMAQNGDFIQSVTDGMFENKAEILARAKWLAENKHRTLGEVRVYCLDDDEYETYTPSGKRI